MTSLIDSVGSRLLRTRAVVRAPIWLYRHRAGRLLGERMLMLEHIGRRSGEPRYVCLEVVERPSANEIVIVSGFGTGAQWYQNLLANPSCRVSSGYRTDVAAHARFLSEEESAAALGRYQAAHPKAWQRLRGAIEDAVGHRVQGLPMVALELE
ncbi:deazaflavin-dependent oxidoreductase (nitroreductase family) [Nocardioides albertanoniae]|uniref:Deazaflavin-dependent oxidoreductase (Nitroreductase family) n=1 Tax=Nocardioides albertanoniae TaxID=1175486 RepID=A0A543A8Z4_9ACTN|nr:nitroreductase family deazaflavin-dependent oxidoreductase [Nocardioides albertanoniae]TQL69078.1 deazaflavin-dependent oxidoreductase (nitroreductase family) [Nocardioides albertanoniae]